MLNTEYIISWRITKYIQIYTIIYIYDIWTWSLLYVFNGYLT